MKKRALHKGFFNSLEKSTPETIGMLMKRAENYVRLNDASRVKRQQNPLFNKKRVVKEKMGESSKK